MRARLRKEKLYPNYCEIYFQSESARNEILKHAKSSAEQKGISGSDLKIIIVELPCLEEQKEIVHRVEHLFAFLPQSKLAKAIRGELVPQDANDKPASMLV